MSDLKYQLKWFRPPVATEDLLSDLRRVAALTGKTTLSSELYSKLGAHGASTAALRFGTWNRAIVAAGLEVRNEVHISDVRLFENLMRLWEHYGRQPRYEELARPPSRYSSRPYYRRFGSWMTALEQFVACANAHGDRSWTPSSTADDRRTGRNPSLSMRFRVLQRDNFRAAPAATARR